MTGPDATARAARTGARDGFDELEVANASFFIDKLGGECGDLQGLRELTINGTEAIAALAPARAAVWSGTSTGSALTAARGASASCRSPTPAPG